MKARKQSFRRSFRRKRKLVKPNYRRKKSKLLTEQAMVKEAVRKVCRSVPGLVQEEQEPVEAQVVKLAETLQQFQARIAELEARTVSSTPQEVRDQREESTKNTVASIKSLTSACKQLSDRSTQTYECLTEDPELKKLEAQLQEAQQQAFSLQAQMKLLTVVERMKRSQEQRTVQQQITSLQGKVMEVTQKLQPVQDEACKVFEEIDGQGSQLDQVVAAVEQCLEGPVTEQTVQELAEQEAQARQQVEAARVKLEDFEAALSGPE
jgi:uncharacterized protein with PIN domain